VCQYTSHECTEVEWEVVHIVSRLRVWITGVGAAASAERGVLGSAELSAAGLLCDAQLAALAETSRECGLRLLLDAEQTDRQVRLAASAAAALTQR
jgi:hypothetical protein